MEISRYAAGARPATIRRGGLLPARRKKQQQPRNYPKFRQKSQPDPKRPETACSTVAVPCTGDASQRRKPELSLCDCLRSLWNLEFSEVGALALFRKVSVPLAGPRGLPYHQAFSRHRSLTGHQAWWPVPVTRCVCNSPVQRECGHPPQ